MCLLLYVLMATHRNTFGWVVGWTRYFCLYCNELLSNHHTLELHTFITRGRPNFTRLKTQEQVIRFESSSSVTFSKKSISLKKYIRKKCMKLTLMVFVMFDWYAMIQLVCTHFPQHWPATGWYEYPLKKKSFHYTLSSLCVSITISQFMIWNILLLFCAWLVHYFSLRFINS